MRSVLGPVAIIVVMGVTRSLRLLEHLKVNCTQEGLRCSAVFNNCSGEHLPKQHTPTAPFGNGKVGVRRDVTGHLVPVLIINWTARTDGSIRALNGAEFRIREVGSNRSVCLQYIFHNKIEDMMNPQRRPWSNLMDRAVVLPGHTYQYSVSNLPKPKTGNNVVEKTITIPDCRDPMIQEARVCVENGSLWKPNISWNTTSHPDRYVIHVGFNTGQFSEKYLVSIQCMDVAQFQSVLKGNSTYMNVSFSVAQQPKLCCESVLIQPFFPLCHGNCSSQGRQLQKCEDVPEAGTDTHPLIIWVILGLCLACGLLTFLLYRNQLKGGSPEEKFSKEYTSFNCSSASLEHIQHSQITYQRKVLIIYSLDHALYREIVLKLSAFLRAKCGTEVVLDLLDTAWLGTVGRMQWLDWQKQQIEKSSDKILILCSRGVQAKWRAMCGGHKVMLKEDVRSPMGDMLTPAFSLIIPDLLHPVAFGKYIVAYFDDVSAEEDVPPPFNITIKYKLMKHFEELYFRILDMEKHEPGKVKRVEGIAEDEYFSCPSGRALRDAIEAFQAYQVEYPDWFERECVDSEEEALDSNLQCPLFIEICNSSTLQCVPWCREEPPMFSNTINTVEEDKEVLSLNPLISDGEENFFTQQVLPVAHLEENQLCSVLPVAHVEKSQVYSAHPVTRLEQSQVYSIYTEGYWKDSQGYSANPDVKDILGIRKDHIHLSNCTDPMTNAASQELVIQGETKPQGRPGSVNFPADNLEEELDSSSCLSADTLKNLLTLQQALGSGAPLPLCSVEQELHDLQATSSVGQEWIPWKRSFSSSDQGYISRVPPHLDCSLKEDFSEPE
ncbi:interleukin-17 receptor A-like [Scleropages formosus]|nr:interleukin-17 receptor A-like [Scleropages formosus]